MSTTEEHVARRRQQQQRDRPQKLVEHGITEMYVSHCDFVVTWERHPDWRWWEWYNPAWNDRPERAQRPTVTRAQMETMIADWADHPTIWCRPVLVTPIGLTFYSQWYLPETDPGWEGHVGYVETPEDPVFAQAWIMTPEVIQTATRLTEGNCEGFIRRTVRADAGDTSGRTYEWGPSAGTDR